MAVYDFPNSNHDRSAATVPLQSLFSPFFPHPNPPLQFDDKPIFGEPMELTFANEFDETYRVEIDENMELEDVMALLEVEVGSNPCLLPCVRYRGSFCPCHRSCDL